MRAVYLTIVADSACSSAVSGAVDARHRQLQVPEKLKLARVRGVVLERGASAGYRQEQLGRVLVTELVNVCRAVERKLLGGRAHREAPAARRFGDEPACLEHRAARVPTMDAGR